MRVGVRRQGGWTMDWGTTHADTREKCWRIFDFYCRTRRRVACGTLAEFAEFIMRNLQGAQ